MTLAPQLYDALDLALSEGRLVDAHPWRSTLAAQLDDPACLTLLARLYAQEGDQLGSLVLLGEALRINPAHEISYRYRAPLLRAIGEHARAARDMAICLRHDARDPQLVRQYVDEALKAGIYEEAASFLLTLTRSNPNNALCFNLVGAMYQMMDRCADAIPFHARAIALDANNADFENNAGTALRRLGRFSEAEIHLMRAVELDPAHFAAWYNLGNVCRSTRQLPRAQQCYEQSIVHNGDFPESHFGLACTLLQHNEWERGWAEFEWRWKSPKIVAPITCELPLWDGNDPAGKRILVVTEQGSGDTLQFVRYTKPLAALGAEITIWAPKETAPLLNRLPHVLAAATLRQDMPAAEVYIPMMSLPRVLNATPETIPTQPYIVFDEDRASDFARKLGPRKERLRIGIAWAGNPIQGDDHLRSAHLQDFAKLVGLKDIRWIGVQKGPSSVEIRESGLPVEDWSHELHSFDDTAALFATLDGVVCVCTGPIHLAGAMGMQSICMLSWSGDWRWCTDDSTTIWYPTMELVRQPKQGDWATVTKKTIALVKSWKQQSLVSAPPLGKK